jgi:hypothetical protein
MDEVQNPSITEIILQGISVTDQVSLRTARDSPEEATWIPFLNFPRQLEARDT